MYVYYTHENNGVMTFERAQTLSIKPASELERVSIKNLVVDVENEDAVICITTTRQIYEVKIRNEALMGMFVDKSTHWAQIGYAKHHGQINCMDVCVRKPLVATCSSDKT